MAAVVVESRAVGVDFEVIEDAGKEPRGVEGESASISGVVGVLVSVWSSGRVRWECFMLGLPGQSPQLRKQGLRMSWATDMEMAAEVLARRFMYLSIWVLWGCRMCL